MIVTIIPVFITRINFYSRVCKRNGEYNCMKQKLVNNGEYTQIFNHNLHIYRDGDVSKPKLVFMSGSGTTAPVYDFKILYNKLVSRFRIIVIEKFGYGYSDLFETACDIDSLVDYQREALNKIGEKGPFIILAHSMSGLEAIRWKQKYPDEIKALIGLDMATPITYMEWDSDEINKRIDSMFKLQKLKQYGLLFWYPMNNRELNKEERKQQRLLWKRNGLNSCFINEAKQVLNNAIIVDKAGKVECPTLLFVSNGKQVSPNWINNQREFAEQMRAELVQFNCGHYVHCYESENICNKVIDFVGGMEAI